MFQYILCVIFIFIFSDISVIAEDVSLTAADYNSFLSMPPYRSFSGFLKPDFVTPDIDTKLQQIASQYNLRLSDVYQLVALMQSENVSMDESLSMINQIGSQVHYEKMNSMFGVPFPMYNMPNFMPQLSRASSMVRLQRREPAEGLVEAIADDTAMNVHKAYNGVKDGLNKAYDNVMKFADKVAPRTTDSMRNVVDSLVGSASSPSLSDKLQSNLRYMMADD